MAKPPAARLLMLPALVAALLLSQQTHAKVTSVKITRLISLAPGPDGVDWEGDDINCSEEEGTGIYACKTSCVGTVGPLGWDTPDHCFVDWRPTCSNGWCAAEITLEAYVDVAPTATNTRMIVNAHPVFFVKQLSVSYDSSKKVKWVFQIGTAVSVGQAPDSDFGPRFKPLVSFLAAQSGQLVGMQTAMWFGCASLPGATATFGTPKVDCAAGGNVEANATVVGCPRLWNPQEPGSTINVFNGALSGTVPPATPPLTEQWSSYSWRGDHANLVSTTGAGKVNVWIRRDNRTYVDSETGALTAEYAPWPTNVRNIRIGHRLLPEWDETVPLEDRPWTLSATKSSDYVDSDADGWGSPCDCNDNSNNPLNKCSRKLKM